MQYDYSVSLKFPNKKVNPSRLQEEILQSKIKYALDHVQTDGDICSIYFKVALNDEDIAVLETIVKDHDGSDTNLDSTDRELMWSEFKTYLIPNIDFVNYIDNGSIYEIWIQIEGVKIFCNLTKVINVIETTEFEANYKNKLNQRKSVSLTTSSYGGKLFYMKSMLNSVIGGMLNIYHHRFDTEVLFFGGEFSIGGTVNYGDYLEFSISDEDNMYGYGAGFKLKTFLEKYYLMPGTYECQEHSIIRGNSAVVIPAGLYLTTEYNSTGASPANDANLIIRLEAWY